LPAAGKCLIEFQYCLAELQGEHFARVVVAHELAHALQPAGPETPEREAEATNRAASWGYRMEKIR
jgi:hypothetical protein